MHHPLFIAIWLVICIGVTVSLWSTTLRSRAAIERKEEAQSRVKQEEARGFELLDKLKQAQSDYEQERIIRDELGLQKPGETILQLPQTSSQ